MLINEIMANYGTDKPASVTPASMTPASMTPAPVTMDQGLMIAAAFTLELRNQAHFIHFSISGPEFVSLHEYFDDVYAELLKFYDTFAEQCAQHCDAFPITTCELMQALPDFEDLPSRETRDMLLTFQENVERGLLISSRLNEMCGCHIDVQDTCARYSAFLNKTSWTISRTLS